MNRQRAKKNVSVRCGARLRAEKRVLPASLSKYGTTLTTAHKTENRGPRLRANWNSGKRWAPCRHAKLRD
jgi:hypothetical protein